MRWAAPRKEPVEVICPKVALSMLLLPFVLVGWANSG